MTMPFRPKTLFSPKNVVRVLGVFALLYFARSWLLCSPYICPRFSLLTPGEADAHWPSSDTQTPSEAFPPGESTLAGQKALIVASLKGDDISWLYTYFPDWTKSIYVMDDPKARLTVEKNVGRESTAYLTYIIDNYDNLPDFMVFLHALRYQWHNEDPMYDGVAPLKNLRLPYVERHGYANMRCTHTLGCPDEIQPYKALTKLEAVIEPANDRANTEAAYARAFLELFPNTTKEDIPKIVGIPCGAQFALTRWKILERPREDYVRYRDWLWTTSLPDNVSGRILEYSWHIIMGMSAVYCPDAKNCFCEKFGLCNLDCPDEGHCHKRYQLPRYANIPSGWPEVGPGFDGWPALGWAG